MRLLDRILRREHIGGHLRRWTLLRLPDGSALYLHHFMCSDGRIPHDHPKRFTTVGLWGGYVEEAAGDWASYDAGCSDATYLKQWRAPWIRSFEPNHIHRLRTTARGCWTLCWVGPTERPWYFYPEAGERIHWRRFHRLLGRRGGCL